MNIELHKLMLELESKYDMNIEEYFDLPEEAKNELVSLIIQFYIPAFRNSDQALMNLIYAYEIKLEQAIKLEEFEEADICKRLLKSLKDIFEIEIG